MRAHELARLLLEGPDLPVIVEEGDPVEFNEVQGVRIATYLDRPPKWYGADRKWHEGPAIGFLP